MFRTLKSARWISSKCFEKIPLGRILPHVSFESSESYRVFNYLHDSNSIFRAGGIKSEGVFGCTVFTGSTLWRCWQTVWPNLDIPLVLWWTRSWSRNDGDALLILHSSLANVGKQEVLLCSMAKIGRTSTHWQFRSDTLLQDESLSEDVREIMRMKYEWQRRVSSWIVKDRGKVLEHARQEHSSYFSESRFWQSTSTRVLLCTCDDLTRTHVCRVTVVILLDPAETLVSLVSSLFWSTALESDQHARASEWSWASLYFCLLFTLRVSVSVWNDTEKISKSLRKCWHPSIGKRSQVLCCTVSLDFVCLFPYSSQGKDFILHCCSQLRTCLADRWSTRLAVLSISFVSPLWSFLGITGESLRNLKSSWSILSSDRFTQTSQCSYSCRTRPAPLAQSHIYLRMRNFYLNPNVTH